MKRRVVGWFQDARRRGLLPVVCCDNEVGLYGMPAPRGLYKFGFHAVGGATDPDDVREPDADDAALLSEHAARAAAEPRSQARCAWRAASTP